MASPRPKTIFPLAKKMMIASWSIGIEDFYQKREWLPCLQQLFTEVCVFDPRGVYYREGKTILNERLITFVVNEQPDYLLLSMSYDEFYLSTFTEIKRLSPKTRILNFFGDDDWRYDDWSRYCALFMDYNLTSKKETDIYARDGFSRARFFLGVDTGFFKKMKVSQDREVSFIGSPVADRADYLRYLDKKGISLTIYGSGWEDQKNISHLYKGFLSSEAYVAAINRSKINLCFTKTHFSSGIQGQMKGRLLEVSAAGGFQLVETSSRLLGPFLTEKSILFSTKDELYNKIRYFLTHEKERLQLAQKCSSFVIRNYSWLKLFQSLFKDIEVHAYRQDKKPRLPPRSSLVYLAKKDLLLSRKELNKKIGSASYISFSEQQLHTEEERAFLHIASLSFSKKPISCSDCAYEDSSLGRLLGLKAKKAYHVLGVKRFNEIVQLEQLAFTKDYFKKHIADIQKISVRKEHSLLSAKNVAFVSFPLVSFSYFPPLSYLEMREVCLFLFRDMFYSLIMKKNYLSPFFFSLLIRMPNYPFIPRYFMNLFTKENFLRLRGKL